MSEINKKDLLEAVQFVGNGASVVASMIQDGLSFMDFITHAPRLVALGKDGMAAWEGHENIKITQISTPEDRAEVMQTFRTALQLPEGAQVTEELIEEGLETLLNSYAFILKLAAATKKG